MAKAFSLFMILAMAVQIIRPIGLPGLKKRSDFWKVAVVAFAIFAAASVLRIAVKGE